MKFLKRLPAIIFVLFIGIMLILFIILPKKEYSSSEKRYLEKPPTLTVESFFSGEFGEQFETYLSDHFTFRNFWVGLNSYYDYITNNNGKNGYYLCSDGYIVNDPTDTSKFSSNLDIINEFTEDNNINTTVLIAPSTGYICSDILPNNHLPYKDDELFDELHEYLNNDINFVDIRDTFKNEYESGNQLYYKTDHHWTSYGAYTAYSELCKSLDIKAKDKSIFDISSIDNFYGTTYSSSCYWFTKPDTLEVWDSKISNDVYIKDGKQEITNNNCFFRDNLNGDDQYTVFLDGNHPYTTIKTESAETDENILIIKDSFAHSLTPFLSNNYKNITMIDMRYYKEPVSDLIKSEKFDKVFFIYSLDNFATDTNLAWLE